MPGTRFPCSVFCRQLPCSHPMALSLTPEISSQMSPYQRDHSWPSMSSRNHLPRHHPLHLAFFFIVIIIIWGSSAHQACPTFPNAWYECTSSPFEVGCSHVTCFVLWHVSRSVLCHFQAWALRANMQLITLSSPSAIEMSHKPDGLGPWVKLHRAQPPADLQGAWSIWGEIKDVVLSHWDIGMFIAINNLAYPGWYTTYLFVYCLPCVHLECNFYDGRTLFTVNL